MASSATKPFPKSKLYFLEPICLPLAKLTNPEGRFPREKALSAPSQVTQLPKKGKEKHTEENEATEPPSQRFQSWGHAKCACKVPFSPPRNQGNQHLVGIRVQARRLSKLFRFFPTLKNSLDYFWVIFCLEKCGGRKKKKTG